MLCIRVSVCLFTGQREGEGEGEGEGEHEPATRLGLREVGCGGSSRRPTPATLAV